jgi:two-component system sensor histidine kinase BaeS
MTLSLRTRLILSYLLVILLGMGVVAPIAWVAVERLYLNTVSASLLAQAQMVAAALTLEPSAPSNPGSYSQTSNLSPGIHTRVIDAQGGVVIDLSSPARQPAPPSSLALPPLVQNAANLVTPQELMSRPEILQALQGKPATAVRRVYSSGGGQVLYAAAPVTSGEGQVLQIVYLATPLPDTQLSALPASLRYQVLGVLMGAVLLSGAAGVLFARRIAHPLSTLSKAAHAVAAGDLRQRVPEDSNISEVAVVGKAFNRMTASLRQADQAKTAFVSDVSHELRTPLTVIKGAIETLQDGAIDDLPARDSFLAAMSRETERLIRLVNDLLVLTRADADALNLHRESFDLAELARSRCDNFETSARKKQVHLVVESDPSAEPQVACLVFADPDRLSQVIDNLLDNALRYAPVDSRVSISVVREGSQVACRVSDAGAGISADHLPYIFERFYRADPARSRAKAGETLGSGLGLAIVRSLVQAHQGRVEAASVEGQGTTITFWLPAVPA